MHKSILFAWLFDGKGGGSYLHKEGLSNALRSEEFAWVHMNTSSAGARSWLKKELTYLDDLIINALLDGENRPRIVEFKEGILLILRGVNLTQGDDPENMLTIRLWIDKYRVISLENESLVVVNDIVNNLKLGRGPKNSGEFLSRLIAHLFNRMDPILTILNEKADSIEELVMANPDYSERQTIVDIRKQAIVFRRHMLPQREVIQTLLLLDMPWLERVHIRHIQESYNRVQRYIEDFDSIRERSQIINDELSHALSDQMNKHLYILSIIAAIFLPLSFVTGLLGINVAGIPGATYGKAFWVVLAGLTALISLQFWLLRKLKWM
jgi:zinc transporter